MKILGVDSSASAASAAVLADGRLLSVQFTNTGLTHSQTLLSLIDNALRFAGLTPADLDLIGVSAGPGSFTGVRIGVAAVKGIAQPLGIRCVGLSTPEVIAKPFEGSEVTVVSAMDARCRQVYTARFSCKDGGFVRLSPDEALAVTDVLEQLKAVDGPIVAAGDGAELLCREAQGVLPDLRLAPLGQRYQSAASVALLAAERVDEAVDAAGLLPCYLRVSQAERELKKKQNEGKEENQ